MSYQSGYQYGNVPTNEDPLSNASNSNSNNNIDTSGYTNEQQQPQQQPQQPQQQQSEGQPFSNNTIPSSTSPPVPSDTSSAYAPRAYLPTYHDYMQSNSHGQQPQQQNGMNMNMNNNMGAGYASNQYFGPSPAYFESQRKSRRNKLIIGVIVGFLFLSVLSHHPKEKSTGSGADVEVVSSSTENSGGSGSTSGSANGDGGEHSQMEPGNTSNDDDTNSNNGDETDATVSDTIDTKSTGEEGGGLAPKMTYLLSYPMSGTTFTMEILKEVTGMSMATNYERFHPYLEKNNDLRPISDDYPDLLNNIPKGQEGGGGEYGYPFWTTSYAEGKMPSSSSSILTFSHCDGYCLFPCEPSQYIHTPSSFEESCRTVTFFNKTKESYDSYITPRNNLNDETLHGNKTNVIKGIIHLIRDPLSNIVARYHEYLVVHEVEWWIQRNNKVNTKQLHDMPQSFRDWCQEMDTNSTHENHHHTYTTTPKTATTHFFSFELEQKIKSIPCHSEFVKYVAWHNNVVEMIWSRGYDSMEVYFEDYGMEEKKVLDEAQRMAEFLDYDVKSTTLPAFSGGKWYRDGYYTEDEIKALMEFIQFMSFDKTWALLERYFQP